MNPVERYLKIYDEQGDGAALAYLDACAAVMDPNIRAAIEHDLVGICSVAGEDYLADYCKRHHEKYGEAFDVELQAMDHD